MADLGRYVTEEGVLFLVPFGFIPDERAGRCKAASCRAVILWCKTPRGKHAPLNTDGTSHFATCPAAAEFRRQRAP